MQEVLESAEFVAENGSLVRINIKALDRFVKRLDSGSLKAPPWDYRHHFYDGSEKTVAYLLALDTINFCFWPGPDQKPWTFRYGGKNLSGYNALAAALKNAMESGVPMDDAEFLTSLDTQGLQKIFGTEGRLQLLDERVGALNELGLLLLKKYQGRAAGIVEEAGNSALCLARNLAKELFSYRDEAIFKHRRVFFYKRAQIISADICGAFKGKKWGRFTDIDSLTVFADYKLPQVLRHLDILAYSPELARKVEHMILLEPGSREEVEIRANTIWASELIMRRLKQRGTRLKAFDIDWILWNLGQTDDYRIKPYHRTIGVFY